MSFFNTGDIINYLGDYTVMPPNILRNSDKGRIDGIEAFEYGEGDKVERIYLYLLGAQQHIWTDFDKIRPIETTEAHLNRAGFLTRTNGRVKVFTRGEIVISDIQIRIPNLMYIFQAGLCVADFSNPTNIQVRRYLKEDGWDTKLFYQDFPRVSFFHEFISYLDAHDIPYDLENILNVLKDNN